MLSTYKYSFKLKQVLLIKLVAIGLGVLGSRWLYLFLLTDYRSHLAPVMILLGISTILYSISLYKMYKLSVLSSVVLATLIFMFCLYMQLSSFKIIPFLFAACLMSLIYAALITHLIIRHKNHRK